MTATARKIPTEPDAFIAWENRQKARYELIDGIVYMMTGGTLGHDVISINIAAADDPMIPASSFSNLALSPSVHLHLSPSGGHLGFIARRGQDPDRRWLDWRIVDWITTG